MASATELCAVALPFGAPSALGYPGLDRHGRPQGLNYVKRDGSRTVLAGHHCV